MKRVLSRINWEYPQPRKGLPGEWDKFVGPGATGAETALMLIPSVLFAVFVVFLARYQELDWGWIKYVVGFLLAFDISGGITTNATSAAKRWYHRDGQTFKHHFGFVLIHILQIAIVGLLFGGMNLEFTFKLYGIVILGSLTILLVPQYVQRSAAMMMTAVGILLAIYQFIPVISGMEWFAAFLFIKLFSSHLVHEEPYAQKVDE